jgi:type IV pilus assembly protein PilE
MQRASGFTLIEVMIVVAVISILASIAYPSYNRYLERSRRADAQQFMMQMDNRQKQILLEQRAFATAPNALNVSASGWTCTADNCSNGFYTITFSPEVDNNDTPPSYGICAVPNAATSQVNDGTLTLESTGARMRRVGTDCSAGTDLGW